MHGWAKYSFIATNENFIFYLSEPLIYFSFPRLHARGEVQKNVMQMK